MAEDVSEKNKDYGLPKVDPQPIDRGQPGIAKEVIVNDPEPNKKDNRLIIIVIAVVALLILASLLYMIFWDKEPSSNQSIESQVEDRAMIDTDDGEAQESMAEDDDAAASEIDDSAIISDEPGSIITISERTNRYYIFVGSYKFRAYAKRHAEKLATDGFAVKLIVPDNWVGMRVAVGNYGNKEEAGGDAQQIRSKYGNEVVISKY